MSIQINSATYLDEKYSPKIVETLRANTFLIPGVTYNPNYEGDAEGAISVTYHVPTASPVATTAVGADYSGVEYADGLVTVNICNAYRKSTKIRNITAASVAYDHALQVVQETTEDVREGRDLGAMAALINGATVETLAEAKAYVGDNAIVAAPDIDSTNVKGITLGLITKLKVAKARPSVMLVSPLWTSAIISAHVGSASPFTPETNEEMLKAGSIGRYLGCSVIENQQLNVAGNNAVALNSAIGTAISGGVDLSKIQLVVYDARFFAFLNHITDGRIVDTPSFAGSLCNIEDNCGMKVLRSGTVQAYKSGVAA